MFLTVIFFFNLQGVLTTGVSFCLIQWVVAHRGPTYPPMFNPLLLVFVAILESLFVGEELFVGRYAFFFFFSISFEQVKKHGFSWHNI